MNVKDVRRLNLEALITQAETIEGLAKGTTLVANYLSQIRSGHRDMGHELARRIEREKNLPPGWMDVMRFDDPDKAMEALEMVQIMSSIPEDDKQALLKYARLLQKNQPTGPNNPTGFVPLLPLPKKPPGTQ